jgi:AbrB family looped-hinge helix DNA binding protein
MGLTNGICHSMMPLRSIPMRTTIDKAGRLVLPKQARQQLGLKAGDALDVELTSDGLCLRPVHESPRLVMEGNVLVHAGSVLGRDAGQVVQEQRDARIAELVRRALE